MISKRLLLVILVIVGVVIIVFDGILIFSNSKETKLQRQLEEEITVNEEILDVGVADKIEKEEESIALEEELQEALMLLRGISFTESVESIEYDEILFSIADETNLQISVISAKQPEDVLEGENLYQSNIFTITVESPAPSEIFTERQQFINYTNQGIDNILQFINNIAIAPEFNTTQIQSVVIQSPVPMSDDEIDEIAVKLYELVNEEVQDEIDEAIEDAEEELEDDEELTESERDRIINEIVLSRVNSKSATEIQALMYEIGLETPKANLIIKIWSYEGA